MTPSKREDKKRTGTFYTPYALAMSISLRTINSWINSHFGLEVSDLHSLSKLGLKSKLKLSTALQELRILDSSVGEGVFLLAMADILYRIHGELGIIESDRQIRQDIISNNLYGVDIRNEPIKKCLQALKEWINQDQEDMQITPKSNIRQGNSLIGLLQSNNQFIIQDILVHPNAFHWIERFPEVFQNGRSGFDIIIGNPPYGNIINDEEKQIIRKTYKHSVSGGRSGTWNIASIFIVRSHMLLREGGEFGFLIPNSILRVGQFAKTRDFILSQMMLREIIDEASPFDGVTLEMVSIFCKAKPFKGEYKVSVTTTREDIPKGSVIPSKVLASTKIFPLYYDKLFADILRKGKRNILTATRGRDLRRDHVRKDTDKQFTVPYATRGSSVKRYKFDSRYVIYADDSFKADKGMMDSFVDEFLVATKNYPFPRCVMKPKGVLHGGGIVKIEVVDEHIDPEVIGLILNSRLIKYLCIRYLTNYSKLTTCLNTGIMEDLPIVYPDYPDSFKLLFRTLQILHKEDRPETKSVCHYLDRIADALVYSLYLSKNQQFLSIIDKTLRTLASKKPRDIFDALAKSEIKNSVEEVYLTPLVQRIENAPRMD